ncbi:MAG TPA: phage holin family protein [Solirubrobacteraceae bacterium]|nr:phage holin family protein [Solirubrobacteraceae bacterium]
MNAGGPASAGERTEGGPGRDGPQNIATAIAEVSERATQLVREEIELAKAEMSEKATKLAKGAVVGVAAGVFFMTALFFVLIGCAWLLYYYLPIGNDFTYFYGFFAMAAILVVLGVLAGLIAARAVKRGSPPVPNMAIAEARKIRESVGPSPAAPVPWGAPSGAAAPAASAGEQQAGASTPAASPAEPEGPAPFGEPSTAAAGARAQAEDAEPAPGASEAEGQG